MATIKPRRNKKGEITSWLITVSGGYENGKQVRVNRTFHANPNSTEASQRKQAEKFAARLETEFDDKKVTDAKKLTFKAVYDDYIQDRIIRRGLAQRTVDSYKKLFDSRLVPEFGKRAIRDISATDINKFLRKLSTDGKERKKKPEDSGENKKDGGYQKTGKKLSGAYCLKYFQQLNELFGYAQRNGIIAVNPCDLVEPPKRDTKEAQYYDLAECAKIVKLIENCSDPEWKAVFSLSFYCGTRPGELLGLNWSDFDGKNIFVQAGSYQGKGQKCIRTDKPKTKRSVRKIQLTPEAISALNGWKKAQSVYRLKFGKNWPEPDAIFTNDFGNRFSSQAPCKAWKRFTAENGLRHLPLYDIRHTHCSLLISSRELSVEEVAARMGHEQTSTTLNIYSHAFANSNERATQALTNELNQAANE